MRIGNEDSNLNRNPKPVDRDWLTVSQTAEYIQCSRITVHRYLASGLLKGSQLVPMGVIRISAISIEKLLERSKK